MVRSSRPIVCTLSAVELQDRGAAWRKVLSSGLVKREAIAGGLRLVAEPGAVAALTTLIDLERECCAWIDYRSSAPGEFLLTAEGECGAVLAGMFDPGAAGTLVY